MEREEALRELLAKCLLEEDPFCRWVAEGSFAKCDRCRLSGLDDETDCADQVAGEIIRDAKSLVPNYADEYQRLAMRTCSLGNVGDMLRHGVFGLASEAGEVASLMQKQYQGHKMDRDHMARELGDVMWFVAEIATAMGLDMSAVMETNLEKLRGRYPDGFEEERSLHREDGDV